MCKTLKLKPVSQKDSGKSVLYLAAFCLIAMMIPTQAAFASDEPSLSQQQASHSPDNLQVTLSSYIQDMQQRLKNAWTGTRPDSSNSATVLFTLHSNGSVSDEKITKSSGVKSTDECAIETVKKTALPPLPAGAPPELDVNFTFHINVYSDANKLSL